MKKTFFKIIHVFLVIIMVVWTFGPAVGVLVNTANAEEGTNQITLTFDSNGGSAVAAITQDFGTSASAPTSPTKIGYTFSAWSPVVPETMELSQTLTAQWTINSYSITFEPNGGSAVSTITQNYGTAVTPPANPIRAGHTFKGWLSAITGQPSTIAATMPVDGQSLFADWITNNNTITFDGNNNTDGSTPAQTIATGAYANLTSSGFAKTGYTFAGWNTLADGTGTNYADGAGYTMGINDVTLYAKWTINTFTLTYTAGVNGSITENSPQTVNYNTDGTEVTAVPDTGYHFTSWSDANTANPRTDATITEDISVTANFAINQLTISIPSLTTSKTYDGNQAAVVTAGTLSGIVSGFEAVTVSAVATYDTKDVGTDKTITVVYTLDGANVGDYIKPIDYVVMTGTITNTVATKSSGGGGGGNPLPTPTPTPTPTPAPTPILPMITPQVLGEKIYAEVALTQLEQILADATAVWSENIATILANVNTIRSASAEQITSDKYLAGLVHNEKNFLPADANRLNWFITYGTVGTKILGAGERAGVINSYKAAFGKLPKTEAEWQDAIKIANGRWPSERNTSAETKAKVSFKNIY